MRAMPSLGSGYFPYLYKLKNKNTYVCGSHPKGLHNLVSKVFPHGDVRQKEDGGSIEGCALSAMRLFFGSLYDFFSCSVHHIFSLSFQWGKLVSSTQSFDFHQVALEIVRWEINNLPESLRAG